MLNRLNNQDCLSRILFRIVLLCLLLLNLSKEYLYFYNINLIFVFVEFFIKEIFSVLFKDNFG